MNTEQNVSFTDAENTNSLGFSDNTKLLERVDIEGTPFKRVITDEGDFITIGQKAITGKLTEEEANAKVKQIAKTDWKLMLAILAVLVNETVAQLHLDMMKHNAAIEEMGEEGDVKGE